MCTEHTCAYSVHMLFHLQIQHMRHMIGLHVCTQEWYESYHYYGEMLDDLKRYLETVPILRTCSCTEFHHYARCVHAILLSLAKKGRQIVPRGKDIRLAGPQAKRGRPPTSPDAYGVTPRPDKQGQKRKRAEGPSSPDPPRRERRLANNSSPSSSTRIRTATTRRVEFPALE